ncbi:hypothetical protein HNP46_006557 [Pseudomonas nitritireducens]|uniref:Uncharacterized protein n=1 Tax=Pseudomonas nitroreducens TaxID=46680 RepID=A0A7W7P429_PSENT|nr:hypothetical protein [Pseudomonas nitritireducens]MBB4867638.1 hypothetical protein [Pseudomonas nitritireducens]
MADPRWLFSLPGGPKISTLAPFSSQASPLANAITCALETSTGFEGGQGLGRIEARLCSVSFDAPLGPFGQLVLKQGAEQSGCLPAFLISALRKFWLDSADGGQS